MQPIPPKHLLQAYAHGVFPMAEDARDPEIFWVEPLERGVLPLNDFHLPRRLRRTLRREPFEIRLDTAFGRVMRECARSRPGRERTWINDTILHSYERLFQRGHAHSVECWREGRLVGGLYGVSLGRAFFGESMFSACTDASKVALVYLIARLRTGGFELLDTQFITEHLSQFGAIEVEREAYRTMLDQALDPSRGLDGDFYRLPADAAPALILQSISQTS